MQPTSITIDDLVFTYPDGHAAIDHLSLKVAPGECIALVGANGAGKSTLFHLLTGILSPTEGGITIGDTRVEKKTLRDIRRLVGLVFQNPDDQLFTTRVCEESAFCPQN
ncbi:ATP-binding cassette domain-containing protein, partial [Eubacterium aggregans]|uniref:ATP-binding cassette domain-containing protein n=1 Tax=Eubacterium aggregans TaxID=81409 RepID=UPI003F383414